MLIPFMPKVSKQTHSLVRRLYFIEPKTITPTKIIKAKPSLGNKIVMFPECLMRMYLGKPDVQSHT